MDRPLPASFWVYLTAFALQAAAVLLFAAYAARPRRLLAAAATGLLAASLACHLAFTVLLGLQDGHIPLTSGFEAVSAWGLLLTALVVEVEWRHRLGLLGAFLAPLSAATLLMGVRFAHSDAATVPGLGDGWLLVHVALAMAAYALLTAAAGTSGAYLVQDRQIKRKRLGSFFYDLPPLEALEGLLGRLVAAGTATLGLAVAAGFVWRGSAGRDPGFADPKIAFTVAVVAGYAAALALRWRGPLRGRRFAAWSLALFLVLFFGVYLVDLYFGGHAFLRAGGG